MDIKRVLFLFGVFFILGMVTSIPASLAITWFRINQPASWSASPEVFVISPGESVRLIAKNLETQGIVRSRVSILIWAWLEGVAGKIQAGEYELLGSQTPREILSILAQGLVRPNEIQITFPEGLRVEDIDNRLAQAGLMAKGAFLQATLDLNQHSELQELISLVPFEVYYDFSPNQFPIFQFEGYLFPDTYRFKKDASPKSIALKMLTNFLRKLTPELRQEISRQNKSVHDVIIMASLIEKEVRSIEDRKLVSGILWKRLQAGMPLQVDATITYLTQKKTTEVTFADLEIDSPYNTYKYKGLPPGPISNPGLESIEAAIFPKESDYWYYLSAKDGTTIFSKTLQEHNRAKALHLRP